MQKEVQRRMAPRISKQSVTKYEVVKSSPNFFTLYQRQNDLVLAVESFSPDDMVKGISDMREMFEEVNQFKKKHKEAILYLSLLSNGGGWVSLGHLMANAMFHHEYPIYGRYAQRKSKLQELFFKADSMLIDNHRFDWITGETFTNSIENEESSTNNHIWYLNNTIKYDNGEFTGVFGMDDDQNAEIAKETEKIYSFRGINFNPNEIILLTDGMCGSTCACFSKHIV